MLTVETLDARKGDATYCYRVAVKSGGTWLPGESVHMVSPDYSDEETALAFAAALGDARFEGIENPWVIVMKWSDDHWWPRRMRQNDPLV